MNFVIHSTFISVKPDSEAGLIMLPLQEFFEAIVRSRVPHAAQSWRGYASSVDIENLQKLFVKAKLWTLVNVDYSLADMLTDCHKTLFKAVKCGKHCLNHSFILTPRRFIECHCVHVDIALYIYIYIYMFIHHKGSS